MTILATDNFVRANNLDLGASWDPCTGDGSANGFQIVSNAAQENSPARLSDVSETNNSATFPNDQYTEVTFKATAADGVGTGSGVMCRAATGATMTRYRAIGSASGYELLRFVTGTPTSLSSGAGTTFTAADKLRLDVQTSGSNCNWSLKKNGVQFASGTDTSPIASGRAGIAYSSTSSSDAVTDLSSFEAGDLAAADIISPSYPDSVNEYEAVEVGLVDNAAYDFYGTSPLSSNDDVVTSHESLPDAADQPEWMDEALYPHYWSHAPPPADVWDPPSDNFVIDPYNYDDQDEPFGFTDAPLPASISADIIVGEDSDGQLEDVDEDYGFADWQVPSDDLPQQGIYEDGQYSDPEDEPFDFYDSQVPANDLPQQALTEDGQYFDPEDEPFDFQSGPLSEDVADQIWGEDGSNQLEEYLDEDFVFSDGQVPDDVTPVASDTYAVRRSPHRRAVR